MKKIFSVILNLLVVFALYNNTAYCETAEELNIRKDSLADRAYKYTALTYVYNVEIFTAKSAAAERNAKEQKAYNMGILSDSVFVSNFATKENYEESYSSNMNALFATPKQSPRAEEQAETLSAYAVQIVVIFVCLGIISFLLAVLVARNKK